LVRTVVFRDAGSDREEFETELERRGVRLPLQSRAVWARSLGRLSWFVGVEDASGPVWGFGLVGGWSRALPGHLILRAHKFGRNAPQGAVDAALDALRTACRRRVLRVDIDAYAPPGSLDTRSALEARGFVWEPPHRTYADTVLIDLARDEDAIFRSLHPTARRHIRVVGKRPVAVRPVTDPSLAPRLDELVRETYARTGGRPVAEDWTRWIAFCRDRPDLARLLGMFRTDVEGPKALLGFVLGYNHGDIGEYGIAASTRDRELPVPVLYAPAWELIRWAKAQGARTFDFGGIGTGGPDVRQAGIGDFKRYFNGEVVNVGFEYSLAPSRLRSVAASLLRSGARLVGAKSA